MGKIFGANTKISGKVGQLLYRQTRTGTVISELPVKPAIPRRSARQMDRRTQWGNLAAIYKQFDSMLRRPSSLLLLSRFFRAAAPPYPFRFSSSSPCFFGGCAASLSPALSWAAGAAPSPFPLFSLSNNYQSFPLPSKVIYFFSFAIIALTLKD